MTKKRDFAFILYPESCNKDFEEVLERLKCPVYWILHDKDTEVDLDTGEVKDKKPHYHVMVTFDNPRSENTAKKICLQCGGNGHLEDVISRKGYARYLMHLDDNFKHRYDQEEVHELHTSGKKAYGKLISSDTDKLAEDNAILAEIIKFCDDNCIIAYYQIIDHCINHRRDWLPVIRKNVNMLTTYVKSKYWYSTCQ